MADRRERRVESEKLVELEKAVKFGKITLAACGMGESSRQQYICPAVCPIREGEAEGAVRGCARGLEEEYKPEECQAKDGRGR